MHIAYMSTMTRNIFYVIAIATLVCCCCRSCTAFLCHSTSLSSSSSSSLNNNHKYNTVKKVIQTSKGRKDFLVQQNSFLRHVRRHNNKNKNQHTHVSSLRPSSSLSSSSNRRRSSQLFMVSSSLTPPGGDQQQHKKQHRSANKNTEEKKDAADRQKLSPLRRDKSSLRIILRNIRNLNRGTATHMVYAALMLLIPTLFCNVTKFRGSCSKLVRYSMIFSFVGMCYDNVISGLGRYIIGKESDENSSSNRRRHQVLRNLTKGRYLFHAAVMPLIFLPMLEVCTFMDNNVITGALHLKNHVNVVSTCFIVAILMALIECIDWLRYDSEKFVPIDQRYSTKNIQHHLAGTYKYTCPNVLKCVLPAIITTLLQIIVGLYITISSISSRAALVPVPLPSSLPSSPSYLSFLTAFPIPSLPGLLILSAGCTALLSATVFSKKPQLQLVLEPLSVAMIWSSASCLY